jgi:hypothetical protein
MARVLAVLTLTLALGACNKRVFERIESTCSATEVHDIDVPVARDADILIVVDNSGSMAEEQAELARNFVNPACPIDTAHLDELPERYQNPSPALYAPGGELAECGFIQLLAAFDNDFRVGVVTTDVSLHDDAPGTPHAQRGCLQRDADGRNVIARADVFDTDPENNDLAARFTETLANIQTFGSPAERGLDAAAVFLDDGAVRAPGCDGDLADFRREGRQLAVLFLTDEQDCSHTFGAHEFGEELASEIAGGDEIARANLGGTATRCYTDADALPSIDAYVAEIKRHDESAKVAVIAGGRFDDDGRFVAGDCTIDDGQPVGGCWGSHGFSVSNTGGFVCSAQPTLADNGPELFADAVEGRNCTLDAAGAVALSCELECCLADNGSRYVSFARRFESSAGTPGFFLDSICKSSYRDTMIDIASFIASVDFVQLASPPKSDRLIVVTVVRDGQDEREQLVRIDADACLDEDGWYYDADTTRIVFCGDARPRPGDDLSVRAAALVDEEQCGAPTPP